MVKKRGLSTVVTTLILILLVFVAIGIVWVVIKNVLSEGVEGVFLEKFTVSLKIKNVEIDDSENNISMRIKRNPGAGDLFGIKFIISNGTNTEIIEIETTMKELEEQTFILNYSGLVKDVSIAPILRLGSGRISIGNIVDTYILFRECDLDTDCDNNNICKGNETCSNGICQLGISLNCDDSNPCNGLETCDPVLGCQPGISLNCDDSNPCNGLETCDPVLGCQPGTPIDCGTMATCTSGNCELDTTDIISWWRFNGNTQDEVGNNHGTISGNTDCNVAGRYGLGCTFDGDSDNIQMSNSLGLTNTFTFSYWILTTQNDVNVYTIANTVEPANGYKFGTSYGIVTFFTGNGSEYTGRTCGFSLVNDGTWHLITGVFDVGNRIYCYVDGDFENFQYLTFYEGMSDTAPEIGAPPNGFIGNDFNGRIDEFMVFDRILSAGEIEDLYNLSLS